MAERSRVIVFSCNWNAYSAMESAGVARRSYAPEVLAVRVPCLGQVSPGIVLKAFSLGAAGVMMLGCPPDECWHRFGYRKAQEVFDRSQKLLRLLGYREAQLQMGFAAADDGEGFCRQVDAFVSGLMEETATAWSL